MASNSIDDLTDWLAKTQDYSTSKEARNRIAGSVDGLNVALRGLNTDTLFWTEPSNFESVLAKGKDGDSDE